MCPFPELMLVLEGKLFFFLSLLLPGISLKRQFLNPIWIIVTNVLLGARGWTQNSSDQSDFFGNRLAATGVVLMGLLIWIQQWRLLETFCCYALSYIRTGECFFFFKKGEQRTALMARLDGRDGFVSSWYEFDSPTGSTDEALSHRWSDRMKLACDGWWWTDGSSNHLPNIFSGCLPFFQTVSGRASPDGSVQQTIWNGRLYFRLDHTTISFTGKIAPLPKWLIADYWVSFSHSSNS